MNKLKILFIILLEITLLSSAIFMIYTFISIVNNEKQNDLAVVKNNSATSSPNITPVNLKKYYGSVPHIFFHSLIIYPQKAISDTKNANGYKDYMITVSQFKTILQQLYENNFILIDSRLLYSFNKNGNIFKPILYLPKGKKPIILSIDDLNYYSYMKNGGFADKLVIENGIVKTEVLTPKGNKIITSDGDVIPIIDKFVKTHPDFSLNGAKGIIGLTGFEGILGYRTQLSGKRGDNERKSVLPVIDALKKSGWIFANHSFSHNQEFLKNTISSASLANDISLWVKQVEPLVGKTNIFIGPFGQVFKNGDPRRIQLINAGFYVLYGVGMDQYIKYFPNYFAMDRIDIDGYRLTHDADELNKILGINLK